MTIYFAWICVVLTLLGTAGAAYFFDRSAAEGIAEAHKEAALANERSLKLEQSNLTLAATVERERSARIELEQKYAWRRLFPEALTKELSGKRFDMYLEIMPTDPEANEYGRQMYDAIQRSRSGIRVYLHELTMPPPPTGVTLSGAENPDKEALKIALNAAKIEFQNVVNDDRSPRVSVGSRPPPK